MLIGIDHLVIAVADPDAAVDELARGLGLEPGGGGRHDRHGTFNRLIWLGDAYLELIGIDDRALAATSWLGGPTLRALDAGGGLATWAIATDAIDRDVASLRARGSGIAEPITGERTRSDGRRVRWRLAAPPRLDPELPPFLIEHDPSAAEWTPDERAERAAGPARLTMLEIAVDDVAGASLGYLRATGLSFRPSLAGRGARDSDIGPHRLRLRPRRDASIPRATIHLAIEGGRTLAGDIAGVRWVLEDRPARG